MNELLLQDVSGRVLHHMYSKGYESLIASGLLSTPLLSAKDVWRTDGCSVDGILVFLLVTNECAHHTHVLFVILFLILNKIENSSVKMLSWRLNSSVAFNIIRQKIEFLGKI